MPLNETQIISSSVAGNGNIYQHCEAELKAALAAQKARYLELSLSKDELVVLKCDAENAQRATDASIQRYSHATLEDKANPSDFLVLNPTSEQQTQSSPKVYSKILFATSFGTMLGGCFALLLELINGRVYSLQEFSNLFEIPVFSIISSSEDSPKKSYLNALLIA